MKNLIVALFTAILSVSASAQDFSIFDLYEVTEKTGVEVIDPRMSNLNETLKEIHKMTPRNSGYECDYKFHGTRLTFQQVLKLLPSKLNERIVRTRTGDKLLKALKNSSFTAAESSCGTHNYSSSSLMIVENNLRFGLDMSRMWD